MKAQEIVEKGKTLIFQGAENLAEFGSPEQELNEVALELTYACNLKCRMCDIWGKYKKDRMMARKEMPIEELVEYFEESRIIKNIKSIVISGGEPFLKKGFPNLVTYFLQAHPKAKIGILSNLYNTSFTISSLRKIRNTNASERIWVGTSLDGLENAHNNTRGMPNAFQKFNETMALMKTEFPEIPVTINYTLTTDNYKDLARAYKYCKNQDLSMSIQFPVSWKDAEIFTFGGEEMNSIEAQIGEIMEEDMKDLEAKKVDERGLMARFFYLDGLTDYQKCPRRIFNKCIAGNRMVTFSPEGKVYFCPLLKHMPVGDLREKTFDEIWLGDEAKKLRKKIRNGFCHCWLNCTVYPNVDEAMSESCRKNKRAKKQSFLQSIFA